MLIKIEFSPNSRARCAICKQKILDGERRLWANLGSGRYGYYYHLDCIISREKPELDKIFYYMYKIRKMSPSYASLLSVLEEPTSSSELFPPGTYHPAGTYQVANISSEGRFILRRRTRTREEDNEV